MSIHTIPTGTDVFVLDRLSNTVIGRGFLYDTVNPPSSVVYTPDLTAQEEILFIAILEKVTADIELSNLPNWATWTASEAASFVNNNILNGQSQAQIDAYIDANVNSLTEARNVLKLLASSFISTRSILVGIAKAIIYIRNIISK